MRVELAGLHRELGATMVYVTHDQVEAMTLGQKIVLLNQGRVQQIGTPRELYERPANLFVATFVGSPTMNVLEGRLVLDGDRAIFQRPDFSIDLGEGRGLQGLAGRAVSLGIRPEALSPGEGGIRGRLELVEHLGSETALYVTAGEGRLVAKASGDWEGAPGQEIGLSLGGRGVHIFVDGERVENPERVSGA